jgi:hypothetical protein
MKLSEMLIILLLVAGFASGMIGFYQGMMTSYGKTTENLQTFNQTARIYNKTYEIFDIMNTTSRDAPPSPIDLIGVPLYLITGAYNAGMLFLEMPNLFMAMISDAVSLAHLPEWSMMIVMGILMVMVIAGIIYFITGRNV